MKANSKSGAFIDEPVDQCSTGEGGPELTGPNLLPEDVENLILLRNADHTAYDDLQRLPGRDRRVQTDPNPPAIGLSRQ